MPLAPCPDCGNQFSTLAKSCPKCGRPFETGELAAPSLMASAPAETASREAEGEDTFFACAECLFVSSAYVESCPRCGDRQKLISVEASYVCDLCDHKALTRFEECPVCHKSKYSVKVSKTSLHLIDKWSPPAPPPRQGRVDAPAVNAVERFNSRHPFLVPGLIVLLAAALYVVDLSNKKSNGDSDNNSNYSSNSNPAYTPFTGSSYNSNYQRTQPGYNANATTLPKYKGDIGPLYNEVQRLKKERGMTDEEAVEKILRDAGEIP